LTDAYGIDADTLPDLPALTGLAIHGLRRAAAHPPDHHRGQERHLAAANPTNPFRNWVDDD
jgi:hypothetical protein